MKEKRRERKHPPSDLSTQSSSGHDQSGDGDSFQSYEPLGDHGDEESQHLPPPPPPGPPPPNRPKRSSVSPNHKRPSPHSTPTRRGVIRTREKTSNYQYAIHEFNQTIEHSLSNDNGLGPGSEIRSDLSAASSMYSVSTSGSSLRSRHTSNVTGGVHHSQHQVKPFVIRRQQGLKPNSQHHTPTKSSKGGYLPVTLPHSSDSSELPNLNKSSSSQDSSKSFGLHSTNVGQEFSTASGLAPPSSSMSHNNNEHLMTSSSDSLGVRSTASSAVNTRDSFQSQMAKLEEVEQNDGNSPNSSGKLSTTRSVSTMSKSSAPDSISSSMNPSSDESSSYPRQPNIESSKDSADENRYHNYPRIYEPVMPDTTYEERYGDAYVDKPIRYIYPSGYQSMRPRGGPWKLSLVIFFFFIWLCVFIVGHCSDQADIQDAELDDDELIIETRWCGSRTLYSMWVVTVLITALAASYCSIIGYIKMRDFSVANGRSQPPGMVGKSEYYVKIDDHHHDFDSDAAQKHHKQSKKYFQPNIYQSDGTPQFWGGHIYRPTQAAVHVTSR